MVTASRSSSSISPRNYVSHPGASRFRPLAYLGFSKIASAAAIPVKDFLRLDATVKSEGADASNLPYILVSIVLILAGGAFAGLTIALMGQDSIYLEVIATSGEGRERKHADKVRRLLARGKHWVLVTLLLANVIVNESLPIVLDKMGGDGWVAVALSTTAIVIFGEIIPQSICVRYGMGIGAFMAPYVYILMLLLSPIAYPVAMLLDWSLGHDEGTVYKKTGLKTLVDLHKTMGAENTRLNEDEVTIIKAVLDLKEKSVHDIMTPMEDVFTMSADTVLDDDTINKIMNAGYSRIPIYKPGSPLDFVGMLLVKILISYDPEDKKRVCDFSLATLPETRPDTSCLDIINFFQEGKSHMVLVSEQPGENHGAIGVVTLEDVIEELIGEEIIDESDVYIDVHKAIRRLAPAPYARMQREASSPHRKPVTENLIDVSEEGDPLLPKSNSLNRSGTPQLATSPKTTFLMRRSSNIVEGGQKVPVTVRGNIGEMKEHLKHLGPSNPASRPMTTRYQSVKIKPGNSALVALNGENRPPRPQLPEERYSDLPVHSDLPAPQGGVGEGLLTGGKDASDGVQALQQGYGTMDQRSPSIRSANKMIVEMDGSSSSGLERNPTHKSSHSNNSVGSLKLGDASDGRGKHIARSGSITENVVDVDGVRKVILETTSSSDEVGRQGPKSGESAPSTPVLETSEQASQSSEAAGGAAKKKRRRNRKKSGNGKSSNAS